MAKLKGCFYDYQRIKGKHRAITVPVCRNFSYSGRHPATLGARC